MLEWALIFGGGMLGSSHCLGMCGGFVLAIGTSASSPRANLTRQTAYTLGRVFTYAALGAAAGYGGLRLTRGAPQFVDAQAVLAVAAGCLLIVQGLLATGWLRIGRARGGGPCLAGGLLRGFLTAPGSRNVFLAGMFTGFLPCGLLYAYLGLAAATSDVARGAVLMALFGLGTAPMLVALGCGGAMLGLTARQRMSRIAAVCVIVVGLASIARAAGYLPVFNDQAAARCLFCR
jgi:sulfite exporter TauE/SafE